LRERFHANSFRALGDESFQVVEILCGNLFWHGFFLGNGANDYSRHLNGVFKIR
jgi:hypothetical protein